MAIALAELDEAEWKRRGVADYGCRDSWSDDDPYEYRGSRQRWFEERVVTAAVFRSVGSQDPLNQLNRRIEDLYSDLHARLSSDEPLENKLEQRDHLLHEIESLEEEAAAIIATRSENRLNPLVGSVDSAMERAWKVLKAHGASSSAD